MHACEVHGHKTYAYEMHAYEMHACEAHALEVHARKVWEKTPRSPTLQTVVWWSICRDRSCKIRVFAVRDKGPYGAPQPRKDSLGFRAGKIHANEGSPHKTKKKYLETQLK
jgi:hypothetical protein